jgi:polyhydroxyalkanoate synthesis repressor PhaR
MADTTKSGKPPITIKKYANRRLYNTATSSYVTLDHLAQMVKDGAEFVVYDAKTGEDITRSVLTHIIVEEEAKGQNLLPINFLRHLIGFYGDSLQALVPRYLDYSMQTFAQNQEQMRHYMGDAMSGAGGSANPFSQFEEMGKQNMAMFENAMKMLTPFQAAGGQPQRPPSTKTASTKTTGAETAGTEGAENQMDELRTKLDRMQEQLDSLSNGDGQS